MTKTLSFVFFFVVTCSQTISQTLESSNLPIVIIDTKGATIVNEPKITADISIISNGDGVRNKITDQPFFSGKIGIEIRGSSSQFLFPKKQYGFELRTTSGLDTAASLLGLPPEEDWILSAPYTDKTLIRDVLAYKIARDLGRYAPRTRFCELMLNGTYNGIYVLTEKIKRDKNRVDISKLGPTEITGDNLTGGYIIKIDKTDGNSGPGWTSAFLPPYGTRNQTVNFQFEYPKYNEIVSQQRQYIQGYVGKFEQALFSSNFFDPVDGYQRYIDVPSFIDFFLVNEVARNVDGYRLSTFLYKKKDSEGGKLFIGPVWDFNLGFGNANYCTSSSTQGFVYSSFNTTCPTDIWLIPFWWKRLMEDDNFKQQLNDRWNALRKDKLKTETILSYVDSVKNVLNVEAQQRNFQRWPVLGQWIWPNSFVGATYESEVSWLKEWISSRLSWMDSNLQALLVTAIAEPVTRNFHIFPNPSNQYFIIDYELKDPGELIIQLTDFSGKKVEEITLSEQESGNFRQQIGNSVSAGIYFYRIIFNGSQVSAGKVIKL